MIPPQETKQWNRPWDLDSTHQGRRLRGRGWQRAPGMAFGAFQGTATGSS